MSGIGLEQGIEIFRLLSDPTRLRLMVLLEHEELSVAELTQITGLTQSRISTHLGRLRKAELVHDRRTGANSYYSLSRGDLSPTVLELWSALLNHLDDAQVAQDLERARELVTARQQQSSWAESVAGRMETQYSPGRTWEATARALIQLLPLGDVLDLASGDGVLAELLVDRAESVTCVDINETVVAAGRKRLKKHAKVRFELGDMHALSFPDKSFDEVFLMQALTYTQRPQAVLKEIARVLRPGGQLVATTLKQHNHAATVQAYDHVNQGFTVKSLRALCTKAGLAVVRCEVTSREQRPPFFEVITLLAAGKD